jgi:hypothetical protein
MYSTKRKFCLQNENYVNTNAEANDDGDDSYDDGFGSVDDTEPGSEQRTVFHQLCASRYK